MLRGYDRTFAVRFSFLMSLPAVLGANILSIPPLSGRMAESDILTLRMTLDGMNYELPLRLHENANA